MACIESLIEETNSEHSKSEHFFVATQDVDTRNKFREGQIHFHVRRKRTIFLQLQRTRMLRNMVVLLRERGLGNGKELKRRRYLENLPARLLPLLLKERFCRYSSFCSTVS